MPIAAGFRDAVGSETGTYDVYAVRATRTRFRLPFRAWNDKLRCMTKHLHIALVSGLVSLGAVSVLPAQSYRPEPEPFDAAAPVQERLSRKSSSIFRRAAKTDPEAQLAYAQSLEADGARRAAGSHYNALVHRWPDAEEAPAAQFAYARLLFARGRHERAFKEFQYLVEFYPNLFRYNDVLEFQFQIANHLMGRRRGRLLFLPGFESPERALPMLETLVANAPNWARTPSVRLTIAGIHEAAKMYDEAVTAYEAVMHHHPSSEEATQAAFRKAACLVELSDRSPRDEQRGRVAFSALGSFLSEHPRSEHRGETERQMQRLRHRLAKMHFERARYYEVIAKRSESALISYRDFIRQFPTSEFAPEALARIAALESMQPSAERPE